MTRNILVVSPYGIGDLLFLTPVFRAARLIPGVEHVDVMIGSRTEFAVKDNPHVSRIYVWDKDAYRAKSRGGKIQWFMNMTQTLRANRYDLFLDYSNRSEYSIWAALLLGIRKRGGLRYKRGGTLLNCALSVPNGFEDQHVADYFADAAEKSGIPVEDRFFEFFIPQATRAESRVLLAQHGLREEDDYGVLVPGGGESWGKDAHFRRWPVSYYAQLISKEFFYSRIRTWVILGSRQEKEMGEQIRSQTNAKIINLAGECPLPVSAGVLEGASLFVGNDGGLLHMARALQVPAAAFYGPVDPKVYGPYPASSDSAAVFKKDLECRPCYKRFRYNSECAHRDCLQKLSPDEVIGQLADSDLFKEVEPKI